MKKTIALIAARKGSKRLPGKNMKVLKGKPLVQYSIEHGLDADLIDQVVVSSDDEKVLQIAELLDCTVIKRPDELATDHALTIDVIKHCLKILEKKGEPADYLVLLQPTVPIRNIDKINEAIEILKKTKCDSVISHIKVDYFHPNRMKKIIDGRIVCYCEEEIENVPRNKLPEAYYRDGSIYAMRAELPFEKSTVYGDDIRPVLNDREFFVNIDEAKDWATAEWLIEKYSL